ncbi:DUF1203 domain-containing protein [Parasulfitobacter algicola]|uniref:DUF1203 domain-containing protein n=1 Tax=Parasulfitobacter algicola TaxID=2614809 RepID=A0ABX2IUR9_9RHOB|nr:DUF1203 domain-containing protein [Sulfitobacter algicola]NSX56643.1 DUF1203 domain-containing protein [Sulfitobacter algicola]
MIFQIHALPYQPFRYLFDLSDSDLRTQDARRVTANTTPGFPCRVSLEDANVGETLILMNYKHLNANSPYASTHAIYVRENARQAQPQPGNVPPVLENRLLSVRGFDHQDLMQYADVIQGGDLAEMLNEIFADMSIRFVDIHNAKPGCFAARATRVSI